MDRDDQEWMAYIEREVAAVCETKGGGHQIRRNWAIREKAVADSGLKDYEWKLLPEAAGKLPDAPEGDFDGTYYVLNFDRARDTFVLEHDTVHVGMWGPHWLRRTYTE